jgi:hypothetical protein
MREEAMPIHDWSRVRPGRFHHFHNAWIYKLCDRLNGGLLPPGFYAAGEQVTGEIEPDVLTLQRREPAPAVRADWHSAASVVAVEEHPPQVAFVAHMETAAYLRKQDTLVIRFREAERIVAMIEIVSRGNKNSRRRLDQFLRKVSGVLDSGYHLLVIDLHPPGSFDPEGLHSAIWDFLCGEESPSPPDRPLTLASYRANAVPTAYVQPVSVGSSLPDMPLFLDADWYVNVPLEETYLQTWNGLPEPWKEELAG